MRDKFRTPEDGKASSFDLPRRDRPLYDAPAKVLSFMVVSALIFGLIYVYVWGHSLSQRVEALESKPESRQGRDEGIQRQLADMSLKLDEFQKRVDSIEAEVGKAPTQKSEISVSNVQEWLKALNFYHDKIDGRLGRNTRGAICNFQYSEMQRSDCSIRNDQDDGFLRDEKFLVRLREKAGAGHSPG